MPLNNIKKVAIYLSSLPDQQCVDLLKNFSEEEIKKVCKEMITVTDISSADREKVITEVEQSLGQGGASVNGGFEYVESILARIFGVRQSTALIQNMSEQEGGDFDLDTIVNDLGPQNIAETLQEETPQVIGIILSSISGKKAADVISFLKEDIQTATIESMVISKKLSEDYIFKIKKGFLEKLNSDRNKKGSFSKEGVKSSAELLAFLPNEKMKKIMDSLRAKDESLATNVESAMFTFDDIVKVDDKDMRKILGTINQSDLKLSLRKANDETKEKVFKNMSERAATMLKEDMEIMGAQKIEDVMTAQQNVIKTIRKLEADGEITIARGEGEEATLV